MIEQAILLCGGRGSRLGALTDDCPKPLVKVAGRPFLDYLLAQLSSQGIKRFEILAGYKASAFNQLIASGGQKIGLSAQPEDWETGRRIWMARDLLDERFLICYGDTLCPDFDLESLEDFHILRNASVTLLHTLEHQPIPDTLRGRPIYRGSLITFDMMLNGHSYSVERGYMICEREALLKKLGAFHNPQIAWIVDAMDTAKREVPVAYTIDTPELLSETEAYLAQS